MHEWNRNNLFTIGEIYHKGYHIYARVLLPERPILDDDDDDDDIII